MLRFEIFIGGNSFYYFRLKSKHGRVIIRSEGYTAKNSCLNSVEAVKRNAANDGSYKKKESIKGYYFTLHAQNGAVLGISDLFATRDELEGTIDIVKNGAENAKVTDLS